MKNSKGIKLFLILILLGISISGILGIEIYNFEKSSKVVKSDCVIILGCSVYGNQLSPFLQWRAEEGYRLFKEGYAKYIIASGGKGPGENISEAKAIEKYLLSKGIDKKYIILEDKSTSTMENIKNCKEIMDKRNFKNAMVVSNKFHLKRASLMTKKVGINANFSGVFVTPYKSHEIYGFIREIPALMKFYMVDC